MSRHILIVEDEADLGRILCDYLARDGFTATHLTEGGGVLAEIARRPPDLMLLDIMLPGRDGLSILKELRANSKLPVILMTARVEEIDRLIGLDLGADDYICKPYSPRELVARVKTVLRRSAPAEPAAPKLVIDAESRQVTVSGQRLAFTPKEFQLLAILSAKPGRVYSREQLLDLIYQDDLEVSDRAIDSHMKNLRKKLAQANPEQELIRSIYGVGFVYEP
jgi:two-component system response regulator BaeR